jgi:hypothetical protein
MVSRERLLRLGATVYAARDKPSARIAGRLLAVALVVLLALRLWQLWRRDPVDFGQLDGGVFAAAVIASVAAVSAYGFVWPYLLRRLGTPAPFSWIGLFSRVSSASTCPGAYGSTPGASVSRATGGCRSSWRLSLSSRRSRSLQLLRQLPQA